jgi:hypothetical protein
VPKSIIATASFKIPSPNRTAFKTGNFSAFINALAATVSVAHKTLLRINISVRVSTSKILLISMMYPEINKNPMTVPTIPKKLIIPKFSKKSDFLRLYPAEKMIGGKIIAKNSSFEKSI